MPIVPNMKVEHIPVSDVIPYAKNAKLHPDYQVDQILASIDQFGFNDPIAIDENNVIIEGHGRLLAAKKLNMTEVPVIRLEHLDDEAKRAYILAHNKLTMNSDFDDSMLSSEMDSIYDIDMSAFGFDFGAVPDEAPYDEIDKDFESVSLQLSQEQFDIVTGILETVDIDSCVLRGGNKNGDKVCEVLRQWEEM